METFLIRAAQLILSLSILVLMHEMGHFFFAKLFKVRVEKFYLFFNPWFSLFRFKPKNSETTYGIGWLPLGGYVKIAGMIDESMDRAQMARPAEPWEFRSKPAWQRLLIMIGGVTVNFILALLIYSSVLFTWGEKYIPLQNMTSGMDFSQSAKAAGFKDGDILVAADGQQLERLDDFSFRKIINAKIVTVIRDGKYTSISIPNNFMEELMKENAGFVSPRFPFVVSKLVPDAPAQKAGIQPGDSLVAINNVPTLTFNDFAALTQSNKGKSMQVRFYRSGQLQEITITPDSTGKIGVYPKNPVELFQTTTIHYSFFEAIPAGISLGLNKLKGYVSDMKYVFTEEGSKQIGGFGSIGSLFPPEWDWQLFWEMTAFLSIILAFMNILPIPALDGGHVLFLLYEIIARRKPSQKFMEYAQITGMILLFSLLIYANGNDFMRAIFN